MQPCLAMCFLLSLWLCMEKVIATVSSLVSLDTLYLSLFQVVSHGVHARDDTMQVSLQEVSVKLVAMHDL